MGGASDIVAIVDCRSTRGYVLSADLLVLERMVIGEGGENASDAEVRALVSTILRRWGVLELSRASVRSLGAFATAFSTPLHLSTPRALRIQALTAAEIPARVRAIVRGVATGREPLSVPGSVNWAAPTLYRSHGLDTSSVSRRAGTAPGAVVAREVPRGEPSPRYVPTPGTLGNVFFSTAPGRAFPVSVRPFGASGGAGAGVVLLAILFAKFYFFGGLA